jgi:hypothetical protein
MASIPDEIFQEIKSCGTKAVPVSVFLGTIGCTGKHFMASFLYSDKLQIDSIREAVALIEEKDKQREFGIKEEKAERVSQLKEWIAIVQKEFPSPQWEFTICPIGRIIWIENGGDNQETVGRAPRCLPYIGLTGGGEYSNPRANPHAKTLKDLRKIMVSLSPKTKPVPRNAEKVAG